MDIEDTEACYRAVKSKDRRFDGMFITAVLTTGIYCRPSCPAITPRKDNVTFYRTAAAAQAAGFRACKRCQPDAAPGSPDWDIAADVAGRAMRLISDGTVEREGVEGLAQRIGYTARHLNRVLTAEVGAGPLALARAHRAQTARVLIETTTMTFTDVAFASGFSSVRQFNDTIRSVYAKSPGELRGHKVASSVPTSGTVALRLPVRRPFDSAELLSFLAARALPGVERVGSGWYERTLRLPHGHGVVLLELDGERPDGGTAFARCTLHLSDIRDAAAAVERCRRLLDADCDPVAVDHELGSDDRLAPLVHRHPGLRVPGHVDGHELALRAVIGQQVSVSGARTVAGRIVRQYGEPLRLSSRDGSGAQDGEVSRVFPTAEVLAEVDPATLPMPRARARAFNVLATGLASGDIRLDRSEDRGDVRQRLLALPGIGPWTADYVAMRALGDPDVFLPGDSGVRAGLMSLGATPRSTGDVSLAWRPWRSYAVMHLWTSASSTPRGSSSSTKENDL